eukprot:scaffold120717_cov63-Phaeocystis_antarctica.AAC.2
MVVTIPKVRGERDDACVRRGRTRLRPLLVHMFGAASVSDGLAAAPLDDQAIGTDPSGAEACRRWVAGRV